MTCLTKCTLCITPSTGGIVQSTKGYDFNWKEHKTFKMDVTAILYSYMETITVIIASFVFVLLFEFIRRRRHRYVGNLPPGPRGWPILGNLPSLDPKAPYKTLDKIAKKYGPIYSLQFGAIPVVILNNYAAVKEAFIKQGDVFEDRPRLLLFEIASGGKGNT